MVDVLESLKVILNQEDAHYQTEDYISRMQDQIRGLQGGQAAAAAASQPSCPSTPSGRADGGDSSKPSPGKKMKSNPSNESEDHHGRHAASVGSETSSTSAGINKHWREKLCEWAYQVVDHFDLQREIVTISMSHLDRYLASSPTPVDKNFFQLLAMTCLYISIKLNEYRHLLIEDSSSSMETILKLSRGFFTIQQMERMEYDILQRLQWHVHPPTPQLFIEHLMYYMSGVSTEIHSFALFLVELSTMDYFFVSYQPSEIALAAIMNATSEIMPSNDLRSQDLSSLKPSLSPHSPRIKACRDRLAMIYAQAENQQTGTARTPTPAPSANATRTTSPVSVVTEAELAARQHGSGEESSKPPSASRQRRM